MSEDNEPVPDSRTYVHSRCGEGTVVSGHDFETLANPFAFTTGTMCVTCGKGFPLREFAWIETGETIADYRKRLAADAPANQKLVGGPVGSIVCGLICAGAFVAIKHGNPGATVGALFGGFVGGFLLNMAVIAPLVIQHLFKVDYRTFE